MLPIFGTFIWTKLVYIFSVTSYYIKFVFLIIIYTGKDQLSKCASENKILITFTNLDGVLSLKLKGYNPTFVLVLPEDKLLYETNLQKYIDTYYMNKYSLLSKNVKQIIV